VWVRALVLLAACSGCLVANPGFDGSGTRGSSSGASDASGVTEGGVTSGATSGATSDGTAGGGAFTASSGDEVTATLGSTGGAGSSDDTSSSADASTAADASSSTTGLPPGEYAVPAAIATCVLLPKGPAPYAGPAVCSANATAQNGTALTDLMAIDVEVQKLDGKSRPSHAFLRFDIPAELGGLTVAAATLRVQVADGPDDLPNGPQSGELVLTGPFDADSLTAAAPLVVMPLAADMGFVNTDQWVMWAIPTELVVAGQPLYLGLLPTDNDGVFYRGAATNPGPPVLDLIMM